MANNPIIRQEFSSHPLTTVADFIDHFSPKPDTSKHTFFKIRTEDGCWMYVWGNDEEEVIERFERFLKLYLFV